MAQSTPQSRTRFAPRPATDPQRWSRVSGGVLPKRARQPQQSTMQKTLARLPGLGGGKAAPASGKGGGRAGGMAVLTAVAGLAYKNRGTIADMLNRRRRPNARP